MAFLRDFWGHCVLLYREDIVIWVQKKTGAPIITVNTVDEAQRFLKKYHTFVVGLFEKFEVFGNRKITRLIL